MCIRDRPVSLKDKLIEAVEPALPYVVLGWLVGVFGLSIWHLGGWAQLQRLRRKMVKQVSERVNLRLRHMAKQLGIKRAVEIAESALVQVPAVVGWLRPVILLPASALTGLSGEQLEAILAHELAHIKRCDYLVNMLQTAVEILGFYHPAVWWVSHKIRAERENCCDDLAVGVSGDRVAYARALTSLEEVRAGYTLAVAASGGSLFERIRRILGKDSANEAKPSWLPSAIAMMLIGSFLIPISLAMSSRLKTDTEPAAKKLDYSSVTPEEGIGFDDIIVGDANCTREFIISKLGQPNEDLKDQETNGWWINYKEKYGIDFWLDKNNVLKEIRFNKGFKGKLQSGISMSSSKYDVFKVYGKPVEEKLVSNLNERVGRKLVHSENQILYKHESWKPEVSKIYYNKHWLLFWFRDNKINQFVVFPKTKKMDEGAGLPTEEESKEVLKAAHQLFSLIRNADYEKILSYYDEQTGRWRRDGWKKLDLDYMVQTDWPSFAVWVCRTFRDNPIESVELGKVFISDKEISGLDRKSWPTVPYKLVLKDGGIIEGNLLFRYLPERKRSLFRTIKAYWQGMLGLDWHLQDDPIKKPNLKTDVQVEVGKSGVQVEKKKNESAARLQDEELPQRSESFKKLRSLGLMLRMYANDHDERYPSTLDLIKRYDDKDEVVSWALENVGYLGRGRSAAVEPQALIAYDKTMLLENGCTNLLFNDSHVEFCEKKRVKDTKFGGSSLPDIENRWNSAQNLSDLGKAMMIFADDYEENYPDSLEEVKSYLSNEQDLQWIIENIEYLGHREKLTSRPGAVLAYDKTLLEKGEGTNVLYNDCRVQFEKPETLKKLDIVTKEKLALQIFTSARILLVPADLPQLKEILSEDKSKTRMITPEKLEEFLNVVQNTPRARMLTAPRLTTNDGEAGQMRTENAKDFESIKLDIKNTVGADRKTITLELVFECTRDEAEDKTITRVSAKATLLSEHAIAVAVNIAEKDQILLLLVKPQIQENQLPKTGVVQEENPPGQIKKFKQQLEEPVTVHIDKSPDGSRLTIQYAVMAVCKAAGVPYNWDKSAELAEPERRQYIEPVNIENNIASQAIADMLGPVGLLYGVDDKGVYLYKPEKAAEIQSNLEILNIELEPVAQGKNIIYATVKNTFDTEQLFAIHIYTRSVDYGPHGVGWGTRFFEKLEPNETKRTRFAYKIQGPVTENTYICVKFYNPATEKQYNYDKPFAVHSYKSSDLKRKSEKKAESISKKDFTEIIIGNFTKVQRFIKGKKYEQAWDLFSQDYQKSEYPVRDFERFQKAMEPKHQLDSAFTWEKSQFLKLKPKQLEINDSVTLLATFKKETWKISFTKEGNQWKIDDIVGYRPRILDMQEADNK